MDKSVIIAHPTPRVLADLLAIVSPGSGAPADPLDTPRGLRGCAWASLLHLRRVHGSLAAASRAAGERQRRQLAAVAS